MSNSLRSQGLQPTRLLHPWDFPGKNTGMGCHFLLQGIFLTQGLNLGLLHCRQTLYCLSHQENHQVFWREQYNPLALLLLKNYFLTTLRSMQDLSSLIRDENCFPCSGSTVSTAGPPGKSPLTLLDRTAHEWLPTASGNSKDCWPKVDHINPFQSLRPWGWGPEQVVVATPGLQHARLLCPSPSPGACSNSCPLSQWCHLTISSSVVHFSSHLQSFPASGSFPMSQFFASNGQSIGTSASASVPSSEYSGLIFFRIDWLDLLAVQGTLKSLLQHHSSKASILRHSAFFMVQLSHPYMTTRKIIA